MIKTLDAQQIANMFLAGAKNLQETKEWINELNVFPVPDGDTGTNMTMTIMTAAEEVSNLGDFSMKVLAKTLSSGSLKGARGNSGVILSQLLRGFSKGIQDYEEVDVRVLTDSFVKATETAYKAVMKPKEGTILTVARGMSEKALEIYESEEDVVVFLERVLARGQEVLEYTPELLPVLKEAGVVDSGGQGLMQILNGAFDYLTGKKTDVNLDIKRDASRPTPRTNRAQVSSADIKFGYCTEFIVMLENPLTESALDGFRHDLLELGDSLVFVADDEMVKIHVHTNHPGLAFEKGLSFGELTRMKVDNMREEHREIIAEEGHDMEPVQQPVERKAFGFVAVAVGSGIAALFREIGVDVVVEGGQTMNPSTQDILDAVAKVSAETVFVLPNNKNIILAAEQAGRVCEDKKIVIIPTVTIPQGVAAAITFDADAELAENVAEMTEAKDAVKSAEVTYAIRNTSVDGFDINEGDIMGIGDDGIRAVGKDLNETTLNLIRTMVDEDSGIISIYYGADTKPEDVASLQQVLEAEFCELDVEVLEGAQPVYYYLISVE